MSILTKWLNRIVITILPFFAGMATGSAQQVVRLNIQEVYRMAQDNYPLIKQRNLLTRTKEYTISNAAKGYIPVLNINGQATYQSDVTSIPFTIPHLTIPSYSKDQYKLFGEVDQVIYDGGAIKNQKNTAEANEVVQQQNLDVQLYALYDRLNQLFLGALLVNEQLKQNDLVRKDVLNGIEKQKALVDNGTAFKSSVDELQAQLLTTEQSRVELYAVKRAYLNMLGYFINKMLDTNTILQKPDMPEFTDEVSRPEILFYDYQKRLFDLQDDMLKVQLRPKFNFFFQGGYARPGLNMLSNQFEWYYIGGVKLNWSIGSWYTLRNQRNLLDINRATLDINKETFIFNTRITQKQQNSDIQKYNDLIAKDDDIIKLRESVKAASSAQLSNGVLSAHDYLTQVNKADEARQNKILHEIQLLQAAFNYQNTSGNIKLK